MEVRSAAAGRTHFRVELEFKAEGKLKGFSRVDLRFGGGDNPSLKEERAKPGRVVVSFTADRARPNKIDLWVTVPEPRGGTVYVLRVTDFVEPAKDR